MEEYISKLICDLIHQIQCLWYTFHNNQKTIPYRSFIIKFYDIGNENKI